MKYLDTLNNRLMTKKCIIDKISISLIGLESKSYNIIKPKAMKNIVKKISVF